MLSFASDYTALAHPKLLDALARCSGEHLSGYGTDPYCAAAADRIRAYFRCPDAQVYFLTGGTQTNQVVISALLRSWEGVVAAETGHIAAHEAGAIEYSGHKVLTLPAHDGRIDASALRALCERFYADENHEHMVFPGMVYLSYPTEYGTLYTRGELQEIRAVCRTYGMPLYIDGARLAYGLAAEGGLSPAEFSELCDVFYIGGTKCGALCGEALVFPRGGMPAHFPTMVKQRGAMLAKGFLLGVQFDALFTDDLYGEIGRRGVETARALRAILREKSCPFYLETPTNQQFIVLDNERLRRLGEQVRCSFWEQADETHTIIRLATSWATADAELDALRGIL